MNIKIAVSGLNASDNPGPGVGIMKCLRAQTDLDLSIVGLAYDAKEAGIYVKDLCDEVYLVPYPSAGIQVFRQRILHIQKTSNIDFFLPALDSELANYQAIEKDLVKTGAKLFLPTPEMLEMRSKLRLQDLCKTAKLKYPKTIEASSLDQLYAGARKIGYPAFAKGIFYEAVLVRNDADLAKAAASISSRWGYPILLQECVGGEEFDIALVGDGQGKILGMTAMKKMQLTEKGKAWGGMTIHAKELFAFSQKLVKTLQWRGPMEVEVMRRSSDGALYLIEINPRFPAWIYLSHGAGCNLPALLLSQVYKKRAAPKSTVLGKPGTLFLRYSQDMIVSMDEYESILVKGELARART
jgi:carbamoyl-phosphate synthase large subunit